MPLLLEAARKEGLIIFWIPLRSSLCTVTEIARYQAAYDSETPLSTLTSTQQDAALKQIAEALMAIEPSPLLTPPTTTPISEQVHEDDAVVKLLHLKRLLKTSWDVFNHQNKLIRQLHSHLKRRLKSKVPNNVGFDETFFILYEEMNHKEKNSFNNIRVITERIYHLNEEMSQWYDENHSLHFATLRPPLHERFSSQLNQLRLHLDLWFNRYKTVFLASEHRSHVYLLDRDVLGIDFPSDLAGTVDDILLELKRE